jgi:hypothetical protein
MLHVSNGQKIIFLKIPKPKKSEKQYFQYFLTKSNITLGLTETLVYK